MKKVYEYKLHLTKNGLNHPEWITDGGYFYDGRTYVAIIEDSVKYYIPNTLIELTKQDLIDRINKIQNDETITDQYTDDSGNVLSGDQLNIFVNEWWEEKINVN